METVDDFLLGRLDSCDAFIRNLLFVANPILIPWKALNYRQCNLWLKSYISSFRLHFYDLALSHDKSIHNVIRHLPACKIIKHLVPSYNIWGGGYYKMDITCTIQASYLSHNNQTRNERIGK